ncbi:MAG TPA: electron transport complex subunit RsxC [Oscillospiraceae bacterium]|nr:electron transport complex subunit RsxC [Oscillospiraceae bacterium]
MKEKAVRVLSPVSRSKGGISVPHHKNTENCEPVRMGDVKTVFLPMLQHIGAPCTPTVSVGDEVSIGQIVGDSDEYLSVPVHASISGKVKSIGVIKTAQGKPVEAVTIESDNEMRLYDGLCPPEISNKEDFLKAVRNSGLSGLGGAGFPTHAKLNTPSGKKVDTLIINGAECEPYITIDYREFIDKSDDVIEGTKLLMHYLEIENAVIAIEDNKPAAIAKMSELTANEPNIKVMALKSMYPQGAEKMMIYSATGRCVPVGKFPADVDCMVVNVSTVSFINRYVKTGKPLVSRSITVDGSAVKAPQNIRVPIGISINEAVDFCGGFKEEPYKIITGGPLMGISLIDTNAPILKTYSAILAFTKKTHKIKTEHDCIRCKRCAAVCPMHLVPTDIERYAIVRDAEKLIQSSAQACIQCGSCAYVCPSGIPLVQYLMLAKDIIREAGAKNG